MLAGCFLLVIYVKIIALIVTAAASRNIALHLQDLCAVHKKTQIVQISVRPVESSIHITHLTAVLTIAPIACGHILYCDLLLVCEKPRVMYHALGKRGIIYDCRHRIILVLRGYSVKQACVFLCILPFGGVALLLRLLRLLLCLRKFMLIDSVVLQLIDCRRHVLAIVAFLRIRAVAVHLKRARTWFKIKIHIIKIFTPVLTLNLNVGGYLTLLKNDTFAPHVKFKSPV